MRFLSALLMAFSLWAGIALAETPQAPREAIGEVFGKTIYRDEIRIPAEYQNIPISSGTALSKTDKSDEPDIVFEMGSEDPMEENNTEEIADEEDDGKNPAYGDENFEESSEGGVEEIESDQDDGKEDEDADDLFEESLHENASDNQVGLTEEAILGDDHFDESNTSIEMEYGTPEEMTIEREKIIRDQMMRLFVAPLVKKFSEENKSRFEPTPQELRVLASEFEKIDKKNRDEEQVKIVRLEKKLAALSPEDDQKRKRLLKKKQYLESLQKESLESTTSEEVFTPEKLAHAIIKARKINIGLYEDYGGGRILWQQAGCEAFDALRRLFEEQQKLGNLKITDTELQQSFMKYWDDPGHSLFLKSDPEAIKDFMQPSWKR